MSGVTLELYVRSLAPHGGEPSRAEISEQVRALVEYGGVDDYELVVWGEALPDDTDHELSERLAQFRAWAAAHDATLVGFEDRPAGSLVDETREVTSLPTVALAEYRDGDLVGVTPHERDGALRTVADHVGALTLDSNPWPKRELAPSD